MNKYGRNVVSDLRKLAKAFLSHLQFDDYCEYGSLGTDCKRPFGNSDVEGDILGIIEWEPEKFDELNQCYAPSNNQIDYVNTLFQGGLKQFLPKEWERLNKYSLPLTCEECRITAGCKLAHCSRECVLKLAGYWLHELSTERPIKQEIDNADDI